ncbi:MAG TPA: MarR family winged helix-turn-helix transcriptional regulator [Kribbella sp.]|nr:MarR family winged helix-turn-helix transcriptional regulator [Kribbella sp.]
MTSPASEVRTRGAVGTCVEDDLGWALGVVFKRYAKAAAAALAEVPGGPRGYQVLATAVQGGPMRQLDLAQQLDVDRTVMTYLLDDLEKAGLVERRPDPLDRRARLIVPTDVGRNALEGMERGLAAAENEVLGSLEASERDLFRSLLQRVAVKANSVEPVRNACGVADELGVEP